MSWCKNDKQGFQQHCDNNLGQINLTSTLGNYIYNYANNLNYVNYLEIGTWNGLGSTKCFVKGFENRKYNFNFYSLECNEEKHKFAKNIYKNIKNVHILNEVLFNTIPDDIYEIFPTLLVNDEHNYWNKIDFDNMISNKKLFFERKDLPDFFDVILLDGGEFTTWYEYNIIKNKCKILILDDTNTNKCKKIVEDIKNNKQWKILIESHERNGFIICEKINLF
jgi:hypothetical protein